MGSAHVRAPRSWPRWAVDPASEAASDGRNCTSSRYPLAVATDGDRGLMYAFSRFWPPPGPKPPAHLILRPLIPTIHSHHGSSHCPAHPIHLPLLPDHKINNHLGPSRWRCRIGQEDAFLTRLAVVFPSVCTFRRV